MTKVTDFNPNGLPLALGGWSTGYQSIGSNTNSNPPLSAVNFVQRITADTSNTLLNPIINFASGSNISFTFDGSVPSNTLRIHSSGGSGGGGTTTITTKDEGSTLSSTVTTLDFVGAGVSAAGAGATTTVTIPGSSLSLPTFVQYKPASGNSSLTLTMDAAPASGNVLVLGSFSNGNAGLSTVSSTNTTWTKMVTGAAIVATKNEIWIGKVSGAGGTTVTVTRAGGNAIWAVLEVSGVTVTPTVGQTGNSVGITIPAIMPATTSGHFVAFSGGDVNQNTMTSIATNVPTTGAPIGLAPLMVGYSLGGIITLGAITTDGSGGGIIMCEVT